jgi:hypothetical protein
MSTCALPGCIGETARCVGCGCSHANMCSVANGGDSWRCSDCRGPTREQQLEEALRALTEALNLDCGDNSCRFARKRGGMRTNGGCRCIESRKPGAVSRIAAAHRAALALLEGDGEKKP